MRTKCFYLFAAVLTFSGSYLAIHGITPTTTVAVTAVVAPAMPHTSTVGAVTGAVRLEGEAPKGKPINMAKEPVCLKAHPTPALTEEVVTGPNNALQNVIVYVSEGLPSSTFDPPSEAAVIDQKTCIYHPHVIALQTNQKLRIVNSDPISHNIHPLPTNNREWNRSQPPGMPPLEESFAREEVVIPVKCNVHPWMRSYIAVFKHPFFSVTGSTGHFDLKNLPPGNYSIAAWHEKYGVQTQQVSIAGGETKTLDFVFRARLQAAKSLKSHPG